MLLRSGRAEVLAQSIDELLRLIAFRLALVLHGAHCTRGAPERRLGFDLLRPDSFAFGVAELLLHLNVGATRAISHQRSRGCTTAAEIQLLCSERP